MVKNLLSLALISSSIILVSCGSRDEGANVSSMVDVCIEHGGGVEACKAKYGEDAAPGGANSSFASSARSVANRRGTVGRCYEGVAEAMDIAFGTSAETWSANGIGAAHAYQFADWANANPGSLASIFRLTRSSVSAGNAPVGSLFIYEPGRCGMSAESGHIEVKVGGSEACSDHCRIYSCEPSYVYVPVAR